MGAMIFSTTLLLSHRTRRENKNVRRADEAFRLGPRGRRADRRGRGLRAGARGGPLRHALEAERDRAATGRDQARKRRASTAPASLSFCTSEHYDRAAHTFGKSYPDLARGLARDYASAPDVVAYPRNERRSPPCSTGPAGGCDSDAVRRRIERVRRRRAAAQRPQGRGDGRSARDGQGEGGRQDLARGADRGRHLRARARSAIASRTGSRCAISRRASNIPRSAAGSRRAAAATSRRSTLTSTISSNCCAW